MPRKLRNRSNPSKDAVEVRASKDFFVIPKDAQIRFLETPGGALMTEWVRRQDLDPARRPAVGTQEAADTEMRQFIIDMVDQVISADPPNRVLLTNEEHDAVCEFVGRGIPQSIQCTGAITREVLRNYVGTITRRARFSRRGTVTGRTVMRRGDDPSDITSMDSIRRMMNDMLVPTAELLSRQTSQIPRDMVRFGARQLQPSVLQVPANLRLWRIVFDRPKLTIGAALATSQDDAMRLMNTVFSAENNGQELDFTSAHDIEQLAVERGSAVVMFTDEA